MNSALQCVANTQFFKEYFTSKSDYYLYDLNETAVLGQNGKLAISFASLMQQMWKSRLNEIAPVDFKRDLDTKMTSHPFAGYLQHDSIEFVSFLLDGLSEDLNLRKKKPATEDPESRNREPLDLSLEYFSNSLRRDYSFISSMF